MKKINKNVLKVMERVVRHEVEQKNIPCNLCEVENIKYRVYQYEV